MKVFDNLILTVSSKLMAFSDFMPERPRLFFNRREYLEYLQAYAARFDLARHVRFHCHVTAIRKTHAGKWRLTVVAQGEAREHAFDAVALCCGPFQKPNLDVTGLENFAGEVVHSYQYRNSARFRGKRVLVVGLAESGADILREISNVASQCTLAIRSYSLALPRLFNGTHSTDAGTTRAHHYEAWIRAFAHRYPARGLFGDGPAAKSLFWLCSKLYGAAAAASSAVAGKRAPRANGKNNLGQPSQPLKLDIDTEWTSENIDAIDEWNRRAHNHQGNWVPRIIHCKNVSFIPNIVSGKIDVKDRGVAGIQGQRVFFHDQTEKEFDAIVLCTGFVRDFSLLGPDIRIADDNVRNLYKHAFHPDHGGRLALIGFVRPFTGGIPICAELQARYFALLCSDKLSLPADVRERIAREKAWEEACTALSPRHTESIPSQALFCDGIAKEIGCLMSVRELVARPRLFVRQWFYAFNQASYRLRGPHALGEAALRELLRDEPGPMGGGVPILLFSLLSMMPRFVHPKNISITIPGLPRPPKTARDGGRRHFLSPRGARPIAPVPFPAPARVDPRATVAVARPQPARRSP
jgi:hypothetical protein